VGDHQFEGPPQHLTPVPRRRRCPPRSGRGRRRDRAIQIVQPSLWHRRDLSNRWTWFQHRERPGRNPAPHLPSINISVGTSTRKSHASSLPLEPWMNDRRTASEMIRFGQFVLLVSDTVRLVLPCCILTASGTAADRVWKFVAPQFSDRPRAGIGDQLWRWAGPQGRRAAAHRAVGHGQPRPARSASSTRRPGPSTPVEPIGPGTTANLDVSLAAGNLRPAMPRWRIRRR